jgi:4-alpha-glucanotransferase
MLPLGPTRLSRQRPYQSSSAFARNPPLISPKRLREANCSLTSMMPIPCMTPFPPDYFSATRQRWGNPLYR